MSDPASPSSGGLSGPHLDKRVAAAVAIFILAADSASVWFFESRGLSNLYGDGIAHIEGARRLFDSLTPGYQEIGSVWLPLFHILAAPLTLNKTLWQTGLAGSLISAAAFAVSAWLLFRLAHEMNRRLAAALATVVVFVIAPNALYVASTPLTEPLMVMWTVLVIYGLFHFQQSGRTGVCVWTAVAAFFGTLTRYDGWFLLPFAALFVFFCRRRDWKDRWGQTLLFCLIAVCGPLLWLWHNAHRFHNAFQFYNGPYSAKAIYAHQLATTGYRYPTDGSLWLSAHYYFEDVRLIFGPWTLMLALLGVVIWLVDGRLRGRRAVGILLWVPLVFYTQSLAHGSIPIYVPTLPPHTYYNLRYGIELGPALALFAGFLAPPGPADSRPREHRMAVVAAAVICVIVILQAAALLSGGARKLGIVRESLLNTPCKSPAELHLIQFFRAHYDGARLLMGAGEWPCFNPKVGIPYRRVLTPFNRKYWRQIRFGAARWVGWVVCKRTDEVDDLMRAYPKAFADFDLVDSVNLPRGGWLGIYRRRGASNAPGGHPQGHP